MQYSIRFVAAVIGAAFTFHAVHAQTGGPLYIEEFSFTNRVAELKDFNNAGEILATLLITNATGNGTEQSVPALIRRGGFINLYPIGTPNIDFVFGEGVSELRDDGGLYVAGTAVMKDGFRRAALWDVAADGSFTFRTMPNIILPEDSSAPGEQLRSYGLAVNRSGVLVGAGDSHLASLATIWNPPYADPVRYLLSTGSWFSEIDETGLLLANGVEFAHGTPNNRFSAAVTVAGGVPTEIPQFELPPATLWPTEAHSMSGEWVAGEARLSSATRAFAWKQGSASAINLPHPPEGPATPEQGNFLQARSINSSGHAAGYFNGGSHSTWPILWHYDGVKHNAHFLSTLIVGDPYPYYQAEYAIEINDHHHIAFFTRDWSGMVLKVYKPLTNGFAQLAQESTWAEEESGRAEFRVKLHRPWGNNSAMTVNYQTIDDTGKAGLDYTAKNGSITWLPGEPAEKTITVQLIDDNVMRPERAFSLRITGGSNVDLAPVRETTCTITEAFQQFTPRNQLQVGWNYGCAVLHGQSQVILKFVRTGGSDGAITFTNFQSVGSSATAGVDYTLPAGLALSWAAGETNLKTLTIPLLHTSSPITEPKVFSITAEAAFSGTEVVTSLGATIIIAPSVADAPPVIDTSIVQGLLQNLSLTVSAIQGSLLQLEQSVDGLSTWDVAAEGSSADGEVRFNAPIDPSKKAGFFRIRTRE